MRSRSTGTENHRPERMSDRFKGDKERRQASGFENTTYAAVFRRLEHEEEDGKQVFIKDMIYYFMPPNDVRAELAPSLLPQEFSKLGSVESPTPRPASQDCTSIPFPYGTSSENGNPTVIPHELLKRFHYTFLIRDPHYSIPSYYRCSMSPLVEITGWDDFYASEAGYGELRRFLDYAIASGLLKPAQSATIEHYDNDSHIDAVIRDICVVDADDLLENPEGVVQAYCRAVGLQYRPEMLHWEEEADLHRARSAFQQWNGWHDDILQSSQLNARAHKNEKSEKDFDREWTQKYGEKGARIIRQCVDDNMDDYLYLKQYSIQATVSSPRSQLEM